MIEETLDAIAQLSPFRRVHPGTKLLLSLGSIIICLVSPSPEVPLISGVALSVVLLLFGNVHPVTYAKILLGPAFFTLMSILILLFTLGGGTVIWQWTLFSGFSLVITSEGVIQSLLILSRVFGCSIALFFLVLTTPMTDLFQGMKRCKIPGDIIDLMMITYRYIFIIYNQAIDLYRAQVMRLGYNRPREALNSFSMLAGMLFITSWNSGEDLMKAMDCRCYDGIIPSLDQADPLSIKVIFPVILYPGSLIGLIYML